MSISQVQILRWFCAGMVCMLVVISCTFTAIESVPLSAGIVDLADTVSAYATVRIAFSVPLADSVIRMNLIPDPGPVYSTSLNGSRDTATIVVTGLLSGSTRYTIAPDSPLEATNGTVLAVSKATFFFFTRPTEQEPNDRADSTVADRFNGRVCGILTSAGDTDYFYIPRLLKAEGVVVASGEPHPFGIIIVDTVGNRKIIGVETTSATVTQTGADSVRFSVATGKPEYLGIVSSRGRSGIRYELMSLAH